jgi:hypothetical protein
MRCLLGYSGSHRKCRKSELGTFQIWLGQVARFNGTKMTSVLLVNDCNPFKHEPCHLMGHSYLEAEFRFISSGFLEFQDIHSSTSH